MPCSAALPATTDVYRKLLWANAGRGQQAHPFLHSADRYFIMHGVQAALAELADAQDLGSCISDVRVQVP